MQLQGVVTKHFREVNRVKSLALAWDSLKTYNYYFKVLNIFDVAMNKNGKF